MSGTLFVVATPIGNLEDITLRALRVLREADLIAAEDTRHTARLLAHYGIATRSVSFHEHNTRARIPQLLDRLSSGANVVLVTDAGTPGVSDPGTELVQAAIEKHLAIDVLPGASAPITAAVASGYPLDPLTVRGFPPAKGRARKEWFEQVAAIPHTCSFFEAPHRVLATLAELGKYLGKRPIFVGRELTKAHQQYVRGDISSVIGQLTNIKGEFTLVVSPVASEDGTNVGVTDQQIAIEFGAMTNIGGLSRRPAISALARKYQMSSREVYAIVERSKASG